MHLTTSDNATDLRYPIGRFAFDTTPNAAEISDLINLLREYPAQLGAAVTNLSEQQLDTPYRPGGWTVRQVIHHLADSHINAAIRIRLALTEDTPTIKPYTEAAWAELPDAESGPIEPSLQILSGVHTRLAALLSTLQETDFARTYFHPEKNASLSISTTVALYSWHSRHHLAHITELAKRENW